MTISLEHIAEGDWGAVERMRQTLQGLVVDTGGQSVGIRFGTASATWIASPYSAFTTVTHGLGRTPVVVVFGPANSDIGYGATAIGATTFKVDGHYQLNVNLTGTFSVMWVAIG